MKPAKSPLMLKKIEFLKAHSHTFSFPFVLYLTFGGFSARARVGTETVVVHQRFEFCKTTSFSLISYFVHFFVIFIIRQIEYRMIYIESTKFDFNNVLTHDMRISMVRCVFSILLFRQLFSHARGLNIYATHVHPTKVREYFYVTLKNG